MNAFRLGVNLTNANLAGANVTRAIFPGAI
jgi:uncharacterized protein YjbI with pentapeptide repeats